MEGGKKEIRKCSWILLVLWILGTLIFLAYETGLSLGKSVSFNWLFYVTNGVIFLSLVGLFLFKKWGFYLFTIYTIYLLIDNIVHLDFIRLIIFAGIYGYFLWYKGFYKNFSGLG